MPYPPGKQTKAQLYFTKEISVPFHYFFLRKLTERAAGTRPTVEEARTLNAVVFDKTGTLTLGEHRVVDQSTGEGTTAEDALRLAAAVEGDSEHPVARAVVTSTRERGLSIPPVTGFEAIPGYGVKASVDGRVLQVGGPNLLSKVGAEPPPELRRFAEDAAERGQGSIYLLENDRVLAAFAVADAVRPESSEAVRRLHERAIEVVMLTGDAWPVAEAVAKELGIDTAFAQVLPDQKSEKIRELQAQGKRVATVGDGVNDAPPSDRGRRCRDRSRNGCGRGGG